MRRPSEANVRELTESVVIPDDRRILFFARDRDGYCFLSHFYAAEIVIDGETWPTVEHFFQAQKSLDPEFRAAIRACIHPGMAKRLGAAPEGPRKHSGQSWFRANGQKHRDDWRDIRLDLMRKADLAKFSQHARLQSLLLATEDAQLVEDTTMDSFWGIGRDGDGENWAGRILMEVRDLLRQHP
jgi:N-glycosidase YbiA